LDDDARRQLLAAMLAAPPVGAAASDRPILAQPSAGAQAIPPIGAGGAPATFAQETTLVGVPSPSYLPRLAAIENPSGDPYATSSTGATGKYQFTPGTWRDYGGGANIHSDPAQDAAMARMTAANQRILSNGLGRPPTDGELYLAHQQGPTGALNLLRNPDAPAGSVTSARNILANNGDPNAPASEFAQKWTSKFPAPSPPPAVTAPSASAYAAMPPSMASPAAPQLAGQVPTPNTQPAIPLPPPRPQEPLPPPGQQGMNDQSSALAAALAQNTPPPLDQPAGMFGFNAPDFTPPDFSVPDFGGSFGGLFG
jgi:hypothetical protein